MTPGSTTYSPAGGQTGKKIKIHVLLSGKAGIICKYMTSDYISRNMIVFMVQHYTGH